MTMSDLDEVVDQALSVPAPCESQVAVSDNWEDALEKVWDRTYQVKKEREADAEFRSSALDMAERELSTILVKLMDRYNVSDMLVTRTASGVSLSYEDKEMCRVNLTYLVLYTESIQWHYQTRSSTFQPGTRPISFWIQERLHWLLTDPRTINFLSYRIK